ncbi:MAG: hypothetical protein RJA70_4469, partial [Pseudomonadota bacterium]
MSANQGTGVLAQITLPIGASPVEGVEAIELTLAESSGPVVAIALPLNHPWKLQDGAALMALLGERGELTWGEQTLSFRFTGFRSFDSQHDALVGVVLSDEVLGWFERRPTEEPSLSTLVYQRQNADANGWDFIRRVLGNGVSKPHGSDNLDIAFPLGSCILRSTYADNLCHLNRVLGLLRAAPTQAWGWCAFDVEQGDDPLRLLGLDAPPLILGKGWAPGDLSQVLLPHRASGQASGVLKQNFDTLKPEQAAALLRQLTRAGIPSAAEDLLEGAEQLPCLPGQIGIGGIIARCPLIQYRFLIKKDDEQPHVRFETTLSFTPLPAAPALTPQTFTSRSSFVEWDEASGRTRVLVSAKDVAWQMMGEGDGQSADFPDAEKNLVCDSVTPFAGRGEFSGFYVAHRPADVLIVEIRDGDVPRAIGEPQVFAEGLEVPDITINSETVRLSGLNHDADITTADGIAIDGAAGTVEAFAEKHVLLKQKVTVTDDGTRMEHSATVTGA